MTLTRERRNEIAWKVLVKRMREKGLSNLKPNEFQRQIANGAKDLNISREEAVEFAEELIMPLVKEMFAASR